MRNPVHSLITGSLVVAALAGGPMACKSGDTIGAGGQSGSGLGGAGGTMNSGTGGTAGAGTGGSAGSGTGGTGTGGTGMNGAGGTINVGTGGTTMGADTSVQTALPAVSSMVNVKATAMDDNVDITFDPVDGARDYRVFTLPADGDISNAGGVVTVKNAIYRCAGDRQANAALVDADPPVQGMNVRTLVDNQKVDGVMRTIADATLGYVYVKPGPGRVPVYAMGDPAPNADTDCDYFGSYSRWKESRAKKYVTTDAERAMLLGQRWRDDGIAFYVPMAAGANTRPVYTVLKDAMSPRLYYVDGPEATTRGKNEIAFQVATMADGPDSQPLMRVHYQEICGKPHDELAVGKARFDRARRQGDQQPNYALHWAGLTGETTLVVEALDTGCPNQGFFAPKSLAAGGGYPAWQTLDQLRAASPTGEVYINGQHEAGNKPKAIARSFVKISPGPKPDLDWFAGFHAGETLGNLVDTPCGDTVNNCFSTHRQKSDAYDLSYIIVDGDRYSALPMLGELWVAYSDVAGDTNGKFRITPTQKATLAADKYLYATMTVDGFTTGRRYPQIIVSEQDAPVQFQMNKGYALVVQTFVGWPYHYQVEVCDHQYWDVNNQCPTFDFFHQTDPNDPAKVTGLAPIPEPGEETGMDRGTRFEIYVSSKRIYTFLNGQPFGCGNLPAASVPAGPVTVTFGDVLYHSMVDFTFAYTKAAMQLQTRRHFDNLGFKSGVNQPAWDESRLPCTSTLKK